MRKKKGGIKAPKPIPAPIIAPPPMSYASIPLTEEVRQFKCRSIEFFEGDNGLLSMTRLLCFLSFFPASYVVMASKNEGTLGWYLGAFVISYVGGKVTDVYGLKPNKPVINAPRADSVNVKTDDGDINVR